MADQLKLQENTSELSTEQQIYSEDTFDPIELMYRLISSWKLLLSLALIFAVAFGVYTLRCITPMYEATSTIYVLSRGDSVINMSDLQIGSALTKDYIKVFDMWEVHEQVISNLNLSYSYKQIAAKLTVSNDSDTRMIDIKFKSASPEEAAAVANEYAVVASNYIAENMATEKPSIMSQALIPTNPVSPNKTKNVLFGFFIGLILGIAIVTVRMLTDDTYKTSDDIRKYTGLPTLAIIPVNDDNKIKGSKNRKAAKK